MNDPHDPPVTPPDPTPPAPVQVEAEVGSGHGDGEAHPADWDEELYQATAQLLIVPETRGSPMASLGCLLASLLLFALSFLPWFGMHQLGMLIPVLFLHEAGHWIGMKLFGYRNMQMFFIPFFGAAVSGSKHAAPAWQQVVVLLLGPLPGIALGLGLLLWLQPPPGDWQFHLVLWLIILNGLNLAPIVPLDGGRIVEVLLFARRPWMAVAFRLAAVAALGFFAFAFTSWILGLLAVGMLIGTPARYRRARLERIFANNPSELPETIEQLDDAQRRDLFGWVRLLDHGDRSPVSLAGEMRSVHEHMVTRRPSGLVWLLLAALYLVGIAGAFASAPIMASQQKANLARQAAPLIARYDEEMSEITRLTRAARLEKDAAKQQMLQRLAEVKKSQLAISWLTHPATVRDLAMTQLEARQADNLIEHHRHLSDFRATLATLKKK